MHDCRMLRAFGTGHGQLAAKTTRVHGIAQLSIASDRTRLLFVVQASMHSLLQLPRRSVGVRTTHAQYRARY